MKNEKPRPPPRSNGAGSKSNVPRKPPPRGGASNLRPYFTSRAGRVFYAADYGYVSWPIGGRA